MLRKITTLGLSVMLAFSVVNAQQSKHQKISKAHAVKVGASETQQSTESSFYNDYMNYKLSKRALIPTTGDTLVFSDYDYPANSCVRQMVDPYDFDNDGLLNPLGTVMTRKVGSYRAQEFFYGDPNGYASTLAFDTTANKFNFGFGMMQTPKAGPLKGQALVVSHASNTSWFTKIDLSTFAPSAPVKFGGNFPSFFYVSNGTAAGTIWANTGGNQKIYKSSDNGASFAVVDSFVHYFKYDVVNGFPSEADIWGSSDGKYLSSVIGLGYVGDPADTPAKDSTDYVAWLHSENGGATWTGEKIAIDGYNQQISNRPNYYPYFQNFGQIESAIDDKGTTHTVANGYGAFEIISGKDTSSHDAIPVCYWNSVGKSWIAISNQKADEDTNYDGNLRSGNSIGQSYPSVSVSADGKYIFVIWQSNEYVGEIGKSAINTYPGDNSSVTAKRYYSDLMAAYSTNGGASFSAPFLVASKKSVSECYPSVARALDVKGTTVTAHFVYYEDKVPGQSIITTTPQNSRSMGPWIYRTFSFQTTGVEDGGAAVVNKFELEQNYPNPFNPTTQITYSLEKSGSVTLKVYNVLGKEVSTLVNNKAEAAGKHVVSFDGSKLSSGMYIYTLTSGNQVISKKMMLVK